ncbi:ribosome hibernation-promoting factor, HPF/YfiA family [Aeromonas simiae]|uniref:Ribosome-associated translation inhibitor RaiA n=1 Tax=Aeromonas simiae TaxID=218936 RepID=A0A5J6WY96_9GAMM|nr:ribosome-associated translation inhibitor RaiA [Aeromonas simiae]QFI55047.1 ribosome-associated translation inhibitor RaiA [Aeromonas simiae]
MKVAVNSRIIEITPAIRERIETRFDKLERLQVPLINPSVVIRKEGQIYVVEATTGIPHGTLFAQAEHEDLYAAVTEMGQKLERQLNRHIDKPNAHRGLRSGKDQCRSDVDADVEETEIIE